MSVRACKDLVTIIDAELTVGAMHFDQQSFNGRKALVTETYFLLE